MKGCHVATLETVMKTKQTIARARKVRAIQADMDRRIESIQQHKQKLAQLRVALRQARKA